MPPACSKYEDCAKPDVAATADLAQVQEAAAAWGAVAAAEQRAAELRDKQAAQEGLQGMSLEGEGATRVHACMRVCASVAGQ